MLTRQYPWNSALLDEFRLASATLLLADALQVVVLSLVQLVADAAPGKVIETVYLSLFYSTARFATKQQFL